MRHFDYRKLSDDLMNYEIMNLVSLIHEYKGKQDLFIEATPDALASMLEVAKIQSTGASNRIEGIYTSDQRLNALVKEKAEPKNRSEKEIAGYREVLGTIHVNYEFITPRANVILQLHRDLYLYNPASSGGRFKNSDNVISETDAAGVTSIRFTPTSAFETPEAVEKLAEAFMEAIAAEKYNPLLLVPMFILDFLCIHPFNDGNGRMSRLLTLLLLYRSGYIVGKYISIEMIIEKTKVSYYEALQESSIRWYEGSNSYYPFVKYMLGVILSAYREFSERVELINDKSLSKPERIRKLFDNSLEKLSKKMILDRFPDISTSTVEVALRELVKENYILKLGAGKNTVYTRNR